jgi:hypothetical protein
MRSTNATHVRETRLDPATERFREIFLLVVGREPRMKRAYQRQLERQQRRENERAQIRPGR